MIILDNEHIYLLCFCTYYTTSIEHQQQYFGATFANISKIYQHGLGLNLYFNFKLFT